MLTIDYDRAGIGPGDLLLDLGCGEGRHTFEALRRGATVVSVDIGRDEVCFNARGAAEGAGGAGGARRHTSVRGDACGLPFADGAFDHVICAETLEHIECDEAALAEIARVLRPGGTLSVSVPRALPERICWALSREYYQVPGGHVRIYRASALRRLARSAGLDPRGGHHAHALHSPYWWLRCALGAPEASRLTRAYQRLLEWDIVHAPTPLGWLERALNPLLGKSVVLYFERLPVAPATEDSEPIADERELQAVRA